MSLKVPPTSPDWLSMTAKYKGYCRTCKLSFPANTRILFNTDTKSVKHLECATDVQPRVLKDLRDIPTTSGTKQESYKRYGSVTASKAGRRYS